MKLKERIRNSNTYKNGNILSLSSVRAMLSGRNLRHNASLPSDDIRAALRQMVVEGDVVRIDEGRYAKAGTGKHWLRMSWRTTDNRALFGDEYDAIMAVAS